MKSTPRPAGNLRSVCGAFGAHKLVPVECTGELAVRTPSTISNAVNLAVKTQMLAAACIGYQEFGKHEFCIYLSISTFILHIRNEKLHQSVVRMDREPLSGSLKEGRAQRPAQRASISPPLIRRQPTNQRRVRWAAKVEGLINEVKAALICCSEYLAAAL